MILDQLARRYGTDKSHADNQHGYCNIYERYLADLRCQPITLLELGVQEGYSLQMWADYFTHPDTHIWGIDHEVHPRRLTFTDPRIQTYISDQADPALPKRLTEWEPYNPFDIIIDDCSHQPELTIASFDLLWPLLTPGGYYIVEDIRAQQDVIPFLTAMGITRGTATFEDSTNDQMIFIKKPT